MPAFVKNLLDDKPHRDLHGAQIFSRAWVDHGDLKDRRILDIGCGFGWFDLVALDAGAAHVTGIEPVEGDLATARDFFDDHNASFAVGSAIEIPFEDASFDTVVCWEVLEHIPKHHEPQAFREIHRVLRPGGVFYMSTPHDSPVIKFGDPAWWVAGHRHYTREQLQGFASGAGLDVEELLVRGDAWHAVAINNLYVAKWIFRRRPFLQQRVEARLDAGYLRDGDGTATAFMKCRRPR